MSDASDPHNRSSDTSSRLGPSHRQERGGIGFEVFLVLAGLALLAERLGWLPNGSDWLFPMVLIAWGCGELYRHFGKG